jgi:hypothetical protein
VGRILAGCGAREAHGYLPVTVEGRMVYRNPRVFMGGELRPPEYALTLTDPARVTAVARAILEHA